MASYAESDATLKRRTERKDYIRSIIATKGKIFDISKIKVTLRLERIRFIIFKGLSCFVEHWTQNGKIVHEKVYI